ncbi:MAG: D-alanyl-D-alanine carboxypeptidase/D-alanyl-D-alanine-endopeptidase [Bacteroidota bacterium]
MLRHTLLVLFLFASQLTAAQTKSSDFEALFTVWQNSKNLASASYGFVATEVESGKLIFEQNADLSLIPASTQKVTTTLTAMAVLGKDFRFETHLKHDGTLDSTGTLNGNLYLEGGGDPSLAYPDETQIFDAWYAALKEKGIKKITGKIIGDARFFDPQINPGTWTWEDLGNYYGAGVSGLNFHRNQYKIYFKSGAEGTQTTYLYTKPELPEMTFVNELKAGGRGDNAFIYGSPYTNFRYIRGTITPNRNEFRVRGSLPDPCAYAASGFKRFLEEKGITVSGDATTYRILKLENKDFPSDRNKQTLLTLKSEPLTDLVEETNRR